MAQPQLCLQEAVYQETVQRDQQPSTAQHDTTITVFQLMAVTLQKS